MGEMRKFDTGATRDSDSGKYDFEGYLSPLVLDAFGEYMTKHRVQSDGSVRDSDNWQKGIPMPQYMKSLFRHFFAMWALHRGYPVVDEKGNRVTMLDAAMGVLFNAQGYTHEYIKQELGLTKRRPFPDEESFYCDAMVGIPGLLHQCGKVKGHTGPHCCGPAGAHDDA